MTKVSRDDPAQVAAGIAMLKAARDALSGLSDNDDQDEISRRVLKALVAAAEVESAEEERLKQEKGRGYYLLAEAHEAVATAFWMWMEDVNLDIEEVSPSSIASEKLLGFAQGMAAARAMSEALNMLVDGSMFAFTSHGARHLLERLNEKPA